VAGKTARVLVDRELADEAMRVLGAKSRSEAARIAVKELLDLSAEIGRRLRRRGVSEDEVLADFAAWRHAKRAAVRKSERQAGKKPRRATGREAVRDTTAKLLRRLGVESKDSAYASSRPNKLGRGARQLRCKSLAIWSAVLAFQCE
jgi:hypothetical protein